MVNRPPAIGGGSGRQDDVLGDFPQDRPLSRSGHRPRAQQWSLRNLHKIDTSAQHFLSNYYGDDDESGSGAGSGHPSSPVLDDQSAYEIFKGPEENDGDTAKDKLWRAHQAPMRTGVVDGKKVVFELLTGVTRRPDRSRDERLAVKHEVVNSDQSSWDVRVRFWLMRFKLVRLTWIFLLSFVLVNLLFAGFFYALDGHGCGDPDMTYANVFAFTVQTSTTIGYGGHSPQGVVADVLVIILSFLSTLMNTLFAGLLFTKFVTPLVNVQFSDVMCMHNVNGVPCLTVRIGNADGRLNRLTDINVRLTCSYHIPYRDHKGDERQFHQSEELRLLSNRQHGMLPGWELRHVLDETSPLFGLHFDEHPANKIQVFNLSVDAVQDLTKSSVNSQADYALEDILIGHAFVDLPKEAVAEGKRKRGGSSTKTKVVVDYSRMSETEPYPVWYPSQTGVYDLEEKPQPKEFGPA
ncbi:hypothetical protein ACHAWF_017133 [Thalassiosira exigua]